MSKHYSAPIVRKASEFTLIDDTDPTKKIRFSAAGITTGTTRTLTAPDATDTIQVLAAAQTVSSKTTSDGTGTVISKTITFTEGAGTTCTGTVVIPAGATLHDIVITSTVLWGGTSAVLKVGDAEDDDGWFTGVDLKATDLLVGEALRASDATTGWGGKNGVYLVAATGRMGQATATIAGPYYASAGSVIGVVTMGTPSTTGRTFMTVLYSVGSVTAATVA